MAALDDILKQAQPGINPQLEDMIAKLMVSGGASPGMAKAGIQGMGQPTQQTALGTGAQVPAGQPGAAEAMAPEEANMTYQALLRRGVPPQIAQQAIANPKLLRDLLSQIYKQTGPQEQPQMLASGQPNRMSAPPLGGGGGY